MKKTLLALTALFLVSPFCSGSTLAGPSFNTDASISTSSNAGDTSSSSTGPSFSTDSLPPLADEQSAEQATDAEAQAPQEFVESKTECRWLTSSINPLGKRYISNEAGQTDYVELEFRYPFTNRSEDRVFTALKDVLLVLACTVETPSGKANVEIRHTNPLRTLKKQRGPGDKVEVVYTLKADESCVISKDDGVTWEEVASKLPSDWWGYAITHQYSVISQKY